MRNRQRPFWTPAELERIYAGPHDHRVLGDGHVARVHALVSIGRELWPSPTSVADLSAGNGVIALALEAPRTTLGDFAPHPDPSWLRGPIEALVEEIHPVDVFVCAETLEHLEDPDHVLRSIRANALVCSVPICVTPDDDRNGEHYWAFDREGFEELLVSCGWQPTIYRQVEAAPGSVTATYQCGCWGCLRIPDWDPETPRLDFTTIDPGR